MSTDRGEQIARILSSLHQHSPFVREAFAGPVSTLGDSTRYKALDALNKTGIMKHSGPDEMIIHPRLREFLSECLNRATAFKALGTIGKTLNQSVAQWDELRRLHVAGSTTEAMNLQCDFDESITDMAYTFEQNIELLHVLLSTQFGNVANLSTKLNQNKYYAKEIQNVLKDLEAVEVLAERVAEEALGVGLLGVRTLVMRRLSSKLVYWAMQIKDAQSVINERLFVAKKLDRNMLLLARTARFLAQNNSVDGFDPPIAENISPGLVSPKCFALRPQVDVVSGQYGVQPTLQELAAKLPAPERRERVETDSPEGADLFEEESLEIEGSPFPVEYAAILTLQAEVASASAPVSLTGFKKSIPDLDQIQLRSWLHYAYAQLASDKTLQFEFLSEDSADELFPINTTFYDILVTPPAPFSELASV